MNFLQRVTRNFTFSVQIRGFRLSPPRTQQGTPVIKINQNVGFIGDGNMAKAICRGMVQKGLISYQQVYVSSPYMQNLTVWKDKGANVTTDNSEVVDKSSLIFLAVKPNILSVALGTINTNDTTKNVSNKLFVSMLAGFTLDMLEELLSRFPGCRVIRIMPNTSMMVGEGCTVYCPGKGVTRDDISIVKAILEVSGVCEFVPESMVNAAGAVAGSGPSFVYLVIEALSDGGVKMGLQRDMATKFAAQTVLGAAKMVLTTGQHAGVLRNQVCSAGGATIAGIHALERGGVRGAFMDAVEAAAKRAEELGQKK